MKPPDEKVPAAGDAGQPPADQPIDCLSHLLPRVVPVKLEQVGHRDAVVLPAPQIVEDHVAQISDQDRPDAPVLRGNRPPHHGISSSIFEKASTLLSGSRSGPLVRVTSPPPNMALAFTTSGNASMMRPISSSV